MKFFAVNLTIWLWGGDNLLMSRCVYIFLCYPEISSGMNIEPFSDDVFESLRWLHRSSPLICYQRELHGWLPNTILSSLALLKMYLPEPSFIILLIYYSVLVANFYYNFYINVHKWAWVSSLCSVWFKHPCYFGFLWKRFSCCAWRPFKCWISIFLKHVNSFTWEAIWAWWLGDAAFSISSLIIGLFRILISSRVNFGNFYILSTISHFIQVHSLKLFKCPLYLLLILLSNF